MSERQRLTRMLKDNETMTKSDFLPVKQRRAVETVWKPPSTCQRVRPSPLKDLHSMVHWKVPKVPYNLFWREDTDVDRANPHVPQTHHPKPVDDERGSVQKMRPRLVMTPAISLDVIEEPGRQLLIDDVYVSQSEHILRQSQRIAELKCPRLKVRAPLPDVYAPPKPITIRRFNAPYVSPEWRMQSVSWDMRSNREFVEPTKEFWMHTGSEDTKMERNLPTSTP